MSNIVRFDDLDNAEIRVTDDGRYSVFDVIKFCGKKGEREVWKRLTVQYPELVTKCDNTSFGGKGGAAKATPVAGRENILYIIGLLPNAIGKAYREASAKVFLQYLDASPELANSVIDRATPEDLKKIEIRLKGKGVRTTFATVLQDHGVVSGWQFAQCTDAIYQPLLGGSCKQVKESMGLAKSDSLRDNLDQFELTQLMFAEALAARNIEKDNLQGYSPCRSASKEAAIKVKSIS